VARQDRQESTALSRPVGRVAACVAGRLSKIDTHDENATFSMTRMQNYRIVIPTRDSARWIAAFNEAYELLRIRPLYIYDTRSTDATRQVLDGLRAEVVAVTPQVDRVEAMLSVTRHAVDTEWVIRFDDDEIPSRTLIDWLDRVLPTIQHSSVAFSRSDANFRADRLIYSRLEDYYFHPQDPTYLDPQWRGFRPRHVTFRDTIHSPGFSPTQFTTAPARAFFVHFDWSLRSFNERIAKLLRYERQHPGAGWGSAKFYLPELHAEHDLRWTAFETDEFNDFARRLVRGTPSST